MEMRDKEEFEPEIERLKSQIDKSLNDLEWTKDICVLSRTDKFGKKNWVAKIMMAKGQLQNIKESLDSLDE